MAIKFLNKTNANDISVVQNKLAVGGDFTPEELLHVSSMNIREFPTIKLQDNFGSNDFLTITQLSGESNFTSRHFKFHIRDVGTTPAVNITSIGLTPAPLVGINTDFPAATLDVNGGIRIANDSDAPDEDKAGTMRYREIVARGEVIATKSRLEMCMRVNNDPVGTSVGVYEWVVIKENAW